MIVFVVSGLWHGANWTFVIWGALHGLYVVVEALIHRRGTRIRLPAVVKVLITFALVSFAWIFFRANSFADAGYVVTHLFAFTQCDAHRAVRRGIARRARRVRPLAGADRACCCWSTG